MEKKEEKKRKGGLIALSSRDRQLFRRQRQSVIGRGEKEKRLIKLEKHVAKTRLCACTRSEITTQHDNSHGEAREWGWWMSSEKRRREREREQEQ